MASEHSMTHTIMQAVTEAAKAAITAVSEAETPANTKRPAPAIPKIGGPVLKHPVFYWKSLDKYLELHKFETVVKKNIF